LNRKLQRNKCYRTLQATKKALRSLKLVARLSYRVRNCLWPWEVLKFW